MYLFIHHRRCENTFLISSFSNSIPIRIHSCVYLCFSLHILFLFFILVFVLLLPDSNLDIHLVNFLSSSFGTQQPIALLKLLFERGGLFDYEKDLKWKIFKDIRYFCAMTTTGGGRNELDARFISKCATLNINRPSDTIVYGIFKSILRGHLSNFATNLLPISDQLIKITLNLLKVR